MKKKRNKRNSALWGDFSKTYRIMKLTCLFILVMLIQVSASTYSQNTKLSLSGHNLTIEQVLGRIEDQSDFSFFYNVKEVDLSKVVNVNVKDQSIDEVLDLLMEGTGLAYTINNKLIIIHHGETAEIDSFNSIQQEKLVKGKVTDSSGAPLPGVTIVVKGTTSGTITDSDGNYTLGDIQPGARLVFTFVGLKMQEVEISGRQVINIVMKEEAIGLDEVVAIGYATRRAGEVTGSISTVEASSIDKMAVLDASEALRTASGITVRASRTPGGSAVIRIRGLGTINDNDPLWVVDGIPGGSVNPDDIETISILKDAAAQAIYGARAGGGVILVTTKTGKKNQKPQVRVNIKSGITKNSNYYDLLNTREYGELLWLEAKNSGVTNYSHALYGSGAEPDIPEYISPARATDVDYSLYDNKMSHEDGDDTYLIMKANKEGTQWLKEADQNAFFLESTVDVTGGSENSTYAFQIGYTKEKGILKWTGNDRYNLRSNVTSNVTDWLEIGEKIGVTYSENWGHNTNHSEESIISWTYRMQPIVPVYDVMGNFAGTRASGTGNAQNPIFLLFSNRNDIRRRMNITGNVYIDIDLLKNFSARTLFGVNYTSRFNRDVDYVEVAHSERGKYDSLTEDSNYRLQWNWTNTFEYSNTFSDLHKVDVMFGTEAVDNNYHTLEASRSEFFSKDDDYIQLATGVQGIDNDGGHEAWSLFSLFGRVNYSYANKYFFEGVIRHDGSSRFGNSDYGTFPAFSVGWTLSKEDFMSSTSKWLDELKIRGGWGETGNDRIGNYNSYTSYEIDQNDSFYPLSGENGTAGTTGFYKASMGNADVEWETTKTINVGIDAAMFKKKLTFSLDLWNRKTTDMLYPKQIPMVLGQAEAPSVNVGEMKNKGVDFELGYRDRALRDELQYNFTLSLSHYKNEIKKLSGVQGEFLQGDAHRELYYTRAENGTSFPEFYGYVVEGIFQTEAEAAAHPPAFGADGTYNQPGHYKYKDINGDKVINSDDRTYIGSPHPDLTGGLNIDLTYRGFNLSSYMYFSLGNDMVNYVRRFIDFKQFNGGRSKDRLYKSWGSPYLKDNTKAKLPIAEQDDTDSQQPSSALVEDASYLRMEHVRLSYDLNRLLKTDLKYIQIFGQITNVFTITSYSGLDPENSRTGANMGIDAGGWPTARRFMFGLTLDL